LVQFITSARWRCRSSDRRHQKAV